jgi:membrane complex biogenesis BtpA family protein
MVHLLPLPGSPGYDGSVDRVRSAALRDAEVLARGGVHGLLVENFGDVPFSPGSVPAPILAHVTALATEIGRVFGLPFGINMLRNDGCGALAAAHASGATFIRVNVYVGARVTDQGILSGIAHDLQRRRHELGAESIRILADVDVKHSAPLGGYRVEDEVKDALERGGADAVVVSGSRTGEPVEPDRLTRIKEAAGSASVWVGSGITEQNIETLYEQADGLIVGTAFKKGGVVTNPVDVERVQSMMTRIRP